MFKKRTTSLLLICALAASACTYKSPPAPPVLMACPQPPRVPAVVMQPVQPNYRQRLLAILSPSPTNVPTSQTASPSPSK